MPHTLNRQSLSITGKTQQVYGMRCGSEALNAAETGLLLAFTFQVIGFEFKLDGSDEVIAATEASEDRRAAVIISKKASA